MFYLGFLVKSRPTQVSWPMENVGSDREDCFLRALVRVILAIIRTLGLRWSLFHLRHHCDIIIVIGPNWAARHCDTLPKLIVAAQL